MSGWPPASPSNANSEKKGKSPQGGQRTFWLPKYSDIVTLLEPEGVHRTLGEYHFHVTCFRIF